MASSRLIDLRSLSWPGGVVLLILRPGGSILVPAQVVPKPDPTPARVSFSAAHSVAWPQVSVSRELGLGFHLCGKRADRVTWLVALTPSGHYSH